MKIEFAKEEWFDNIVIYFNSLNYTELTILGIGVIYLFAIFTSRKVYRYVWKCNVKLPLETRRTESCIWTSVWLLFAPIAIVFLIVHFVLCCIEHKFITPLLNWFEKDLI